MDLNWRRQLWRSLLTSIMAIVLIFGTFGCGSGNSSKQPGADKSGGKIQPNISEASPPAVIQKLHQELDSYQPQVTIVSPKPNEVLQDNTISIKLQVRDLPIYKNADFGLGPHLHVFLDNQPYQAVYDVTQPLVLEDLPPGTHTLRIIASSPWNESFKNEAAYAQTTFHIFTKTEENNPNPTLPLLTYNQPQGSYGAEPILLDFELTNAAPENADTPQVRIRCTINGESFTLEPTSPIYLQGFKSGKNWVQLELIDAEGNPIKNAFNNTIRIISYNKEGQDTLSQLVRGELSADDARGIVDPNYVAKEPTPTPEVTPTPTPEVTPIPIPEVTPTPTPEVTPTPTPLPDATETPAPPLIPVAVPSPTPVVEETPPAATSTPIPVAIPSPAPTVEAKPPVQASQEASPQVEDETQPTAKPVEQPKPGGFFNRFQLPETGETTETKQAEKPNFGGFFNRFRLPPAPAPSLSPVAPKAAVETPEVNPSISPQPSSEPTTSVEEKPAVENTSEVTIPVETEEITKQIESSKDGTTESDLEPSSGQKSSAPATPTIEAPKAAKPSEKTTGVLTES